GERMFKLILILLSLSSFVKAETSIGTGGQAVQCTDFSSPNTSMVSLYGFRRWNYNPTNLGSTLKEALENMQKRISNLSPYRGYQYSSWNNVDDMFENQVQFISGIELLNQKDWNEQVVTNCAVQKVILSRSQPNQKENFIDADIWSTLSPTTQATLLWEQFLLRQEFYNKLGVDNIRQFLAFVVSEQAAQASAKDFMVVQSQARVAMDFRGVLVDYFDTNQRPWPSVLKFYRGNWISFLGQRYSVTEKILRVDEEFNVRGAFFNVAQKFAVNGGRKVEFGGAGDEKYVSFDEAGFALSGFLSLHTELKDRTFTAANGNTITCEYSRYIEFNRKGEVTKCTLAPLANVSGKILLASTEVQFCPTSETCQNNFANYFEPQKQSGKFELIDFPTSGHRVQLELSNYMPTIPYSSDENEYGDMKLHIKNGANYFGSTIHVFKDARLALAEIVKPVTVESFDYSKRIEIKVAPSGVCPYGNRGKFRSVIRYHLDYKYGLQDPRVLERVINAEKVTLPKKDSARNSEVSAFSEINFDHNGKVTSDLGILACYR
ncbi:MAG TPA: hypothetical protein VGE46_07725, partial [Bdellovibrio sp.]